MNEKDFKKILKKHLEGVSGKSQREQLLDFEHHFEAEQKDKIFNSEQHRNQIHKSILRRVKNRIHPQRNRYWMAAGISIILAAGISFLLSSSLDASPEMVTISARDNQSKTIVLQDGSKITLNQNSVLEFSEQFSDTMRSVKLQGEAYFKVVHDSKRPFKVYAQGIVTKVLGTEFNIEAQDQKSSVALISGSVQVSGLGVSEILKKNQKIEFDYRTNQVERKNFEPQLELFWLHQELVFKDEPLGEIVKTLEREFEVVLTIEDESLSNMVITGTFKGKGLSAILLALSKAAGFEFKGLNEKNIKIYKSQ